MKKRLLFYMLVTILVFFSLKPFAQVSINADGSQPHNSAMLDVKSSSKGFLPPRMTHAELNTISNPADGLMVYCTDCGTNGLGAMTMSMGGAWYTLSANCLNPVAPLTGDHEATQTQVVWKWNKVSGAIGYKWNTVDNYTTATDMITDTSKTETGLNCFTAYTRYVWSYNACGISNATTLTKSTIGVPVSAPGSGTHIPGSTAILWKWNAVSGATGYKWSSTNDYANALDMSASLQLVENGLTCNTSYTRYVWAYNECTNSLVTILTQSTTSAVLSTPPPGILVASPTQIIWNWNTVPGATGYKWNTSNDILTATDMGPNLSKTETGLNCNTPYTRYVWAYTACGVSSPSTLTQSTTILATTAPTAGTHEPSSVQIIWHWNTVSGATGYKWSTTNDFASALDMGTNLSKTETELTCNTPYTRFIWAYNECGHSTETTLTQTTTGTTVTAPTSGTNIASPFQILWKWNKVTEAAGYKWNSTNNYASATDMGADTSKTETGLTCLTAFTRYVWAYNTCGISIATTLSQSTTGTALAPTTAGTHIASPNQIVWKWNAVTGAIGYKWGTTNNYAEAIDMGVNLLTVETGLQCNTAYTRYVWAYDNCTNSLVTALTQTTINTPVTNPAAGTHIVTPVSVEWHWNAVPGATGYKWNTVNDYATATDMGTSLAKTETGLTPGVTYNRFVWAYNTCLISAPTPLTSQTASFTIGMNYEGGVIFYIDGSGVHGLIAAPSDQGSAPWGCSGLSIGTSPDIGTGSANTTAIINSCSTAGIAARICSDLVLNGKNDWFLPSKDELNQMYLQKTAIGNFGLSFYLSSSESNSNFALGQYFSGGNQSSTLKSDNHLVRAIRNF